MTKTFCAVVADDACDGRQALASSERMSSRPVNLGLGLRGTSKYLL